VSCVCSTTPLPPSPGVVRQLDHPFGRPPLLHVLAAVACAAAAAGRAGRAARGGRGKTPTVSG
jgi:hypothetical protein